MIEACRQVHQQMVLVCGSGDFSNWSRGVTDGEVLQMKCNWQRSGTGAVRLEEEWDQWRQSEENERKSI